MLRLAEAKDIPAMRRFLARHAATAMFLRGNLAAHGTDEVEHPHGTRFYLAEEAGRIRAIGGITNSGYLMCQRGAPCEGFPSEFAKELRGRVVIGMTGQPEDVGAVLEALGCSDADFATRNLEPLYDLDLETLQVPHRPELSLRMPQASDVVFLVDWFQRYHLDTGLKPVDAGEAVALAQTFIAKADARIMLYAGQPVAMTAFNARAEESVQIGGVYVPDALRGQGYGGMIVALHLDEVRRQDVERAILFAATEHAARAYETIGFSRIGSYEIALLAKPWTVPQ